MSDDLLASFARVKRAGAGWMAQCPAHGDRQNSLSIGHGENGKWLLKCHAGCELAAILDAAGLTMADLFTAAGPSSADRIILACYNYRDAAGELRYQVVRYSPKTFSARRPDGAGGWIPNLQGTARVLYRLPEIQHKPTVFICEGEKDCDRLFTLGLPATTCTFGAGKWIAAYTEQLTAAGVRHVVVLPDNDAPGATHGRAVARACTDAGLDVKLIPLPDLPANGDVSNYLDGHTKDDLLALVREAPLFNPAQPVAEAPRLTLTSLADLLRERDDPIAWIVDDRIPAGAVVLFVGAPKAGKSTAVRQLALAVARGEPWLGWQTASGRVWLLCFEDKRSEIRRHLRTLGATGGEPIALFTGQAPSELLPELEALAVKEAPALIILDTLARALKVKDLNDYSQVTTAFEPLLRLARQSGAALVLVHHASVHAAREGLDAVLGSTALSGSVDNVLVLRRADNRRTLSSVQRIGPDLEPVIVALNAESGHLYCAGPKRIVEDRELRDQIVAALASAPGLVRESWIHDRVEGRKADQVRALRILLSQKRVERIGRGGRGDPFLYRVENTGSHISGTRIDPAETREPVFSEKSSIKPGLFDAAPILVPEVPDIYREPVFQNDVRTSFERTSSFHDPILVPESPQTAQTDSPKTAESPDKHGADSGSRILSIAGRRRQKPPQ